MSKKASMFFELGYTDGTIGHQGSMTYMEGIQGAAYRDGYYAGQSWLEYSRMNLDEMDIHPIVSRVIDGLDDYPSGSFPLFWRTLHERIVNAVFMLTERQNDSWIAKSPSYRKVSEWFHTAVMDCLEEMESWSQNELSLLLRKKAEKFWQSRKQD